MALPGDDRAARHLLGDEMDHLLRAPHDVVVVGVGFVELELREFGIVLEADALVAEVAADLVDAVESAHDQPLQIQFKADAQVEVLVQLVVMRDKGARRGAAVDRLQDGRLHLQEAFAVEVVAQGAQNRRPCAEQVSRISGFASRST